MAEKLTIEERVAEKLTTEEKMIAAYGGVRIRMDIDRRDLWSEQGDVTIGKLREICARYPHMPRLSSLGVLAECHQPPRRRIRV